MSFKEILLITLLGASVLVSVNALNIIFYSNISLFLVIQIFSGPLIAFGLLSNKYKQYRTGVLMFIIAFSGGSGLLIVASGVARYYIDGNELLFPYNVYHSLVSIICLIIFSIWTKSREQKKSSKDS